MALNLYKQIAKTGASSAARLRSNHQPVPVSALYDVAASTARTCQWCRRQHAVEQQLAVRQSRAGAVLVVQSSCAVCHRQSFGRVCLSERFFCCSSPGKVAALPGIDEILRELMDHGSTGVHRPSVGERTLCFVDGSFIAAAPIVGKRLLL